MVLKPHLFGKNEALFVPAPSDLPGHFRQSLSQDVFRPPVPNLEIVAEVQAEVHQAVVQKGQSYLQAKTGGVPVLIVCQTRYRISVEVRDLALSGPRALAQRYARP